MEIKFKASDPPVEMCDRHPSIPFIFRSFQDGRFKHVQFIENWGPFEKGFYTTSMYIEPESCQISITDPYQSNVWKKACYFQITPCEEKPNACGNSS